MLSRTVSVSSGLSRLATTRSLTATPPLLGKFGNAPRNDEPRDPKKHSYERKLGEEAGDRGLYRVLSLRDAVQDRAWILTGLRGYPPLPANIQLCIILIIIGYPIRAEATHH